MRGLLFATALLFGSGTSALVATPFISGDLIVATVRAGSSPGDIPAGHVHVISDGRAHLIATPQAAYRDLLVVSPIMILGTSGTTIQSISAEGAVGPYITNVEEGTSWLSPAGHRGFVQGTSVSPTIFVRGPSTTESYDAGFQNGGLDLDADLCTLFYTALGTTVRRHDICTDTANGVFASPGVTGFSLRILADGSVLTNGPNGVRRFSNDGSLIRSYANASGTFAIARGGSSIWTALSANQVGRIDLGTGTLVEGPFELPSDEVITALAVADEPRRAGGASVAFAADVPSVTSAALLLLMVALSMIALQRF